MIKLIFTETVYAMKERLRTFLIIKTSLILAISRRITFYITANKIVLGKNNDELVCHRALS